MSTDVDTTPTRLTERELAEHVSAVLDRVAGGERIVIERDGKEIVVLEPVPPAKEYWTWGDFVHFLKYEAAWDEEFVKNVRAVRESQPEIRIPEWPE